jgi:type VI secretion system secreted protein VgrG
MSSFRFKLLRRYEKRNIVVQYRETDLNFVKRFVEDLGFITSVSHTKKSHRVTFSDTQPKRQTLRLRVGTTEGDNSLSSWNMARKIPVTRYTLANHGQGEPSIATSEIKSSVPLSALEIYDYEPSNASAAELQGNAVVRVEESNAESVVASGGTGDRRLRAGDVIKIEGHATDSGNYLVTESFASYNVFATGPMGGQTRFSAIPIKTRYRPQRNTAWPVVSGLQRAQVVDADAGKNRLRIRFSWDRAKSAKRKGSAWVSLVSPMRATSFAKGDWVAIGFSEGDLHLPMVLSQAAPTAPASP